MSRLGECSFPGSEAGWSLGLDDSAPSGIIMRDPVESSGLWRFVGIRRAEVRGQFPCSRGDSGVPQDVRVLIPWFRDWAGSQVR